MERVQSLVNQLFDLPSPEQIKQEHNITLVDAVAKTTSSDATPREDAPQSASREEAEPSAAATTSPLVETLSRKLNATSLQQSVRDFQGRQKYGSFYRGQSAPTIEGASAEQSQPGEEATPAPSTYLERASNKTTNVLKRKRVHTRATDEPDTMIDILYENQRGAFIFGVPRYSANSLLPSDPRPWQNSHFRTSPVDIRTAQVPDPSWQWVWKSWYVDMSRDVDEEGWEYSFMFKAGHNWHGNHPWFHSFVRRRRWLRMRRRKEVAKRLTKDKSHEMAPDYFTIHPRTLTSLPDALDSKARSVESARAYLKREDEQDVVDMDVTHIGELMSVLRHAAVDRQKLVAVRGFIAAGSDEMYYLSERMPEIMSLLVYQSSRRQLLAELESRFDQVHQRRESLKGHDHNGADEKQKQEHDAAVRHAENLLRAVQAADAEVQKLEYWSDIKGMSQQGLTLRRNQAGQWETTRWSGLDPSRDDQSRPFRSKQDPTEPPHELTKQPERAAASDRLGSQWFDAKTHRPAADDAQVPPTGNDPAWLSKDEESDHYITAAESASESSSRRDKSARKSKIQQPGLDGVREANEEGLEESKQEEAEAEAEAEAEVEPEPEPSVPHARKGSVELVEPKALDDVVE